MPKLPSPPPANPPTPSAQPMVVDPKKSIAPIGVNPKGSPAQPPTPVKQTSPPGAPAVAATVPSPGPPTVQQMQTPPRPSANGYLPMGDGGGAPHYGTYQPFGGSGMEAGPTPMGQWSSAVEETSQQAQASNMNGFSPWSDTLSFDVRQMMTGGKQNPCDVVPGQDYSQHQYGNMPQQPQAAQPGWSSGWSGGYGFQPQAQYQQQYPNVAGYAGNPAEGGGGGGGSRSSSPMMGGSGNRKSELLLQQLQLTFPNLPRCY